MKQREPKANEPTCQHRGWLETDKHFPSGPECGKPATNRVCDEDGKVVCAEHKCRCNLPLAKPVKVAEPSDEALAKVWDTAGSSWRLKARALYQAGRASLEAVMTKAVGDCGVEIARLEAELARLRTALESAQADRQRAVDDLFEQLRDNESLRANSMREAAETIRSYKAPGITPYDGALAQEELFQQVADWLEQQAAPSR